MAHAKIRSTPTGVIEAFNDAGDEFVEQRLFEYYAEVVAIPGDIVVKSR